MSSDRNRGIVRWLAAGAARWRRGAGLRRLLARRAVAAADERGRARRRDGRRRRRGALVRDRRLPAARPTCQNCHVPGERAGDTQLLLHRQRRDRLRDRPRVRRHLGAGRQSDPLEGERQRPRRRDASTPPDRPSTRPSWPGSSKEHHHEVASRTLALLGVSLPRRRAAGLRPARERQIPTRRRPRRITIGGTARRRRRRDDHDHRHHQHGTDTSYTFTSANPSLATVDGAGVVTGIAARRDQRDGHRRRHDGNRQLSDRRDRAYRRLADPLLHRLDDVGPLRQHRAGLQPLERRQGSVPITCARCHSSEGFIDYLGGDGSAPGVVDKPAPTRSVIRCVTCHNPAADALSSVTFPSGVTVDGLGGEARCMTCHQGRSSGRRSTRRSPRPRRPRRHRQRERSTSRTSTSRRPPPRSYGGRAQGRLPVRRARSTTSASATSTATTPASAVTIPTRPRSTSAPAPAATPVSPTSPARTRSG